jgi:hypothetical protein
MKFDLVNVDFSLDNEDIVKAETKKAFKEPGFFDPGSYEVEIAAHEIFEATPAFKDGSDNPNKSWHTASLTLQQGSRKVTLFVRVPTASKEFIRKDGKVSLEEVVAFKRFCQAIGMDTSNIIECVQRCLTPKHLEKMRLQIDVGYPWNSWHPHFIKDGEKRGYQVVNVKGEFHKDLGDKIMASIDEVEIALATLPQRVIFRKFPEVLKVAAPSSQAALPALGSEQEVAPAPEAVKPAAKSSNMF